MSAAVKYTLGRLALLAAVALLLLPLQLNIFLTLMIAVLVSMVLSYFLLRRWREELAGRIEQGMRQRRAEKQRLRDALAGDDQAQPEPKPQTGSTAQPGSTAESESKQP
ncbi:MAG: DUF4229 domain-containing protein [Micromonosporaceae bacterium]